MHTGIRLHSLMMSIITPSFKEIGLQMSECKPILKVVVVFVV